MPHGVQLRGEGLSLGSGGHLLAPVGGSGRCGALERGKTLGIGGTKAATFIDLFFKTVDVLAGEGGRETKRAKQSPDLAIPCRSSRGLMDSHCGALRDPNRVELQR